jgi:oxygen-dependent protoporphyrinogen oxidase
MIAVIGGGMAGATAAHRLGSLGHDVVLLEAGEQLGGRTSTVQQDGFTIDSGAVYLLSLYARTFAMLPEAAAPPALARWRPVAGLFDAAGEHRVQYDQLSSFAGLDLLRVRDKARLAAAGARILTAAAPDPYDTDSLAAFDTGETMEAWSRRRLGDAVHAYVVRPLIEPIFGVGCEQLSAPFLHALLKRVHQVGFSVPVGGMRTMVEALAAGADVRTGTRAERVERRGAQVLVHHDGDGGPLVADGVVVATPAPVAVELLGGAVPEACLEDLGAVRYAAMQHVVVGWDRNPWPGREIEMALPVGPGDHPAVGIILHAGRTPGGVPAGAQLASVYLNDRFSRGASDEEGVARARRAIDELLGPSGAPAFARCFTWDRALALCPPGHYGRMQRLRRALPPRIQLAGDYLAQLGVETAVRTGELAAHEVARA